MWPNPAAARSFRNTVQYIVGKSSETTVRHGVMIHTRKPAKKFPNIEMYFLRAHLLFRMLFQWSHEDDGALHIRAAVETVHGEVRAGGQTKGALSWAQ